ncbi:MAG: hypothetical protein KDD36_02755 [Flavobacteriales bacterium]|nr:hypothetical protein [Flavobacteriales bacterium]
MSAILRYSFRLIRLLWVLPALMFSCQSHEQTTTQHKTFFDLKQYIASEANRLTREHPNVTKTVTLDGQIEEKNVDAVDWTTELAPFTSCNINEPALWDKYQVDSTGTTERLTVVYQSLKADLKVQEIRVHFENDRCVGVQIKARTESRLYGIVSDRSYDPDKGYELEGQQDVTGLPSTKYAVKTRYRD